VEEFIVVYILLMFIGIVFLGIVAGLMLPRKRRRMGRTKQSKPKQPSNASRRTSLNCRSDAEILISSLDDLSGPEFERLLALYFLDQGCAVKEVGVCGNDGGVDLVITYK
jgi:restriction system protein